MTGNTRLKAIAVATYLLIIPLVLYFKYFPTIVNSLITNVLLLALLSILTALLVYGSFLIKKSPDICLLLPQTLIIAFVVRAVPNLRLTTQFASDAYPFWIEALNIIHFGASNPVLNSWWGNLALELHWPQMPLLTAATVTVTGIDAGWLWRFQEPLVGALFVLASFTLARLVLKNDGAALLAALIPLSATNIVWYQSEYQPQGFVFVSFVFLVYAYLLAKETKNRSAYVAFVIFLGAFIFSHHASSFFVGALAIGVALIPLVLMRVPWMKPEPKRLLGEVAKDYTIWLLIGVSALAYHFVGFSGWVQQEINMLAASSPSNQLLAAGTTVPLSTTLLNGTQYIWLLLAGVSLVLTLKTKSMTILRCAVLVVALVIAGVAGTFVIVLPLDRVIGFYVPLGALFVVLTVYRIKDQWFRSINKSLKVGLLIALICVPLVGGVINASVPALHFKDSNANPYYYSSNDLSSSNKLNTTGTWMNHYADQNATVDVEWDTYPVFYYSAHSMGLQYYAADGISPAFITSSGAQYVVVSPSIPYSGGFNKTAYLNTINVVYDDGVVNVGDINAA